MPPPSTLGSACTGSTLASRDDGERVIVNHVIADLDATAKFAQVLARVTRALINRRRDGRV